MSELKAKRAYTLDEIESICSHAEGDEYYPKSEVDKVIAHNKFKRCLAMAAVCFEKSYSTTLVKYDKKSGLLRNFYDWWGKRWLELSEKFKEVK